MTDGDENLLNLNGKNIDSCCSSISCCGTKKPAVRSEKK